MRNESEERREKREERRVPLLVRLSEARDSECKRRD